MAYSAVIVPRLVPYKPPGEFSRELPQPIRRAAAAVRSRRFGFYIDILGAAVVMALFVAAAILV